VEDSLKTLVDLKARADLPEAAVDVGLQQGTATYKRRRRQRLSAADQVDLVLGRERLSEIEADPSRVVSGEELDARLRRLRA